MKRLFLIIVSMAVLLPGLMVLGQANHPTEGKQSPEAVRLNTVVKDASWYTLFFSGEKVGTMQTTLNEVSVSATDSAQTKKIHVFLREVSVSRPGLLPYVKFNEEVHFNVDNMELQKFAIKVSLADKRDVSIKGVKDGGAVKTATTILTPAASGEPISQTTEKEFPVEEHVCSEQSLGFLLMANNWTVNRGYPLRFISPYSANNLLVDGHFVVKEKSSQRIMDVMTDGYLCSLTLLDPSSSVKEIEYFIGMNGVILKQVFGGFSMVKTVREELLSQDPARKFFERRGRLDPFTIRLTPAVGGASKSGDESAQVQGKIMGERLILAFLTEAREQLQLMKDIYDKAPEDEKDKLLFVPYQRILEIYQKVIDLKDLSAKSQMEDIRAEAEHLFAGAEKIYAESLYIKDEARKDFELKNFKELPRNLSKMSELSERKEVKGTELESKIKALLDEVSEFARRAKIIDEFYNMRPVINGIIYYVRSEEVKLPPLVIRFLGSEVSLPLSYHKQTPSSSIMVGNKIYNDGDKVLPEMVIVKIQPNAIVFNYKNEEIMLEYKGK